MHELSIVQGILDAAGPHVAQRNVRKVERLTLKIGELMAIEPDSLRFCFEALSRGTVFEGAELDVAFVNGYEIELESIQALCEDDDDER